MTTKAKTMGRAGNRAAQSKRRKRADANPAGQGDAAAKRVAPFRLTGTLIDYVERVAALGNRSMATVAEDVLWKGLPAMEQEFLSRRTVAAGLTSEH